MEATCSSETLVDFQRTILHFNPEDRNLRNHSCENLNSYKLYNITEMKTWVFGVSFIIYQNQEELDGRYM
jgi:hypothetical protein